MERQRNGQTASGERPAPSSGSGTGSAALAGLAPATPAKGVLAPAPSPPGHPDGARSPSHSHRFPSDPLSGPPGALPLVLGGTACSQRSSQHGWAGYPQDV